MTGSVRQIKALQKDIKKYIDSINYGGCVHFAYYFSKKLSYLGIKNHVVFLDKSDPIKISYKDFDGVDHAMVFIPNIGYIDGLRIVKDFRELNYRYIKSKIPLTKLDNFRNMEDIWCSDYDTEQNFLLQDLINEHIR